MKGNGLAVTTQNVSDQNMVCVHFQLCDNITDLLSKHIWSLCGNNASLCIKACYYHYLIYHYIIYLEEQIEKS